MILTMNDDKNRLNVVAVVLLFVDVQKTAKALLFITFDDVFMT